MAADPSLTDLLGRLAVLERRVEAAVARRKADDPNPDDPFRGLYITEQDVRRLLTPPGEPEAPEGVVPAGPAGAPEGGTRLGRLAATFGLDPFDLDLLLTALAPDLDARFERLYGYLHDDVSRRRASIGLALELCGGRAATATARGRLGPHGRLVAGGLVLVEDPDRPFLTRSLRVPDRVGMYVLGDDRPDPAVAELVSEPVTSSGSDPTVAAALRTGASPCYVRDRGVATGGAAAAGALAALGIPVLRVDLERVSSGEGLGPLGLALVREARLRGAALVAGPIDGLAANGASLIRALAEADCQVVLTGFTAWDPRWSQRVPLVVEAGVPDSDERVRLWGMHLDGELPPGVDPGTLTAAFRLGPDQIARAADSARLLARLGDRPIRAEDLLTGSRAQNTVTLERLARRIEPVVGWDDLVLPEEALEQLRELAARSRHRERVLRDWGLDRANRAGAITALFAGESGTGKTMAAEVLAGDLGLDLYAIDLATVVDKYIGETEKNLDRVFVEAERANGILFFDEADALFGKRSEVRDAHDRYANLEIAYLLQRMEAFQGIAILATNLRANLDEAFARRLDALVEFPLPDEEDRLRLWELCLGPSVPRGPDLDLEFCARAFALSGGNIRKVCLTAAYLAAEAGLPVSMADLIRATVREYRKLGRLCLESEFGPYFHLVAS